MGGNILLVIFIGLMLGLPSLFGINLLLEKGDVLSEVYGGVALILGVIWFFRWRKKPEPQKLPEIGG